MKKMFYLIISLLIIPIMVQAKEMLPDDIKVYLGVENNDLVKAYNATWDSDTYTVTITDSQYATTESDGTIYQQIGGTVVQPIYIVNKSDKPVTVLFDGTFDLQEGIVYTGDVIINGNGYNQSTLNITGKYSTFSAAITNVDENLQTQVKDLNDELTIANVNINVDMGVTTDANGILNSGDVKILNSKINFTEYENYSIYSVNGDIYIDNSNLVSDGTGDYLYLADDMIITDSTVSGKCTSLGIVLTGDLTVKNSFLNIDSENDTPILGLTNNILDGGSTINYEGDRSTISIANGVLTQNDENTPSDLSSVGPSTTATTNLTPQLDSETNADSDDNSSSENNDSAGDDQIAGDDIGDNQDNNDDQIDDDDSNEEESDGDNTSKKSNSSKKENPDTGAAISASVGIISLIGGSFIIYLKKKSMFLK